MEEFNQLFSDDFFEIDKPKEKTLTLKEGERRIVSILFADIKGFTALSESLDHEEVRNLVDQLLKIFSKCVDLHGGFVDKYTGDQIMALFGAKKASEVDTQRAINTGFLMLSQLKKFNKILKTNSKYSNLNIEFSIRVGINTGMVTTGAVGKERKGDFTVYGDAVNLASRMESNAPINTIMVPEETMTLVKDYFVFKNNSTIKVKGKNNPISVFTLKSKKDKSIIHSSPFLGRDNEIKKINQFFKQSKNDINKINLIGISAEAGIGKTRLVHEYLKKNNIVNFSISNASNISSKPYLIFITLIKDIFKISEIDSIEKIKIKFDSGMKKLIEENIKISDDLKLAIPFLGFLINLKYDDKRLQDKEELHNHIKSSLRSLINAISYKADDKNPYIIIFDDIHWIDKMSLEMLEYLVNTFNNLKKKSKILLICTYRSQFQFDDKFLNELSFHQLHLSPLNKNDSIKLIKHNLSDLKIDNKVISDLIDKSKGNPFFIEEWISLIKEKKKSSSIKDSKSIKNYYDVPKTINSIILARIDSLGKTLKLILQKATVIGEDFFIQILSLLETKLGAQSDVDKIIVNLKNEDFIHNYINQKDHYKFKHILTRDVAYSTILVSNKKILHLTVAEIIEEYFSDKLEIFYLDLAVHFDIAESYENALKYLFMGANKQYEIYDYIQATKNYERIIEIIENEHQFSKILKEKNEDNKFYKYYVDSKIRLAEILLNTGKWDDAKELYKDILNLSTTSNDYNYKIYRDLGQYYNFKHNYNDAIKYLSKALSLAEKLSDVKYIAPILGKIGLAEYDIGNLDKALEKFNEELKLFKKIKDCIGQALAEGHIGMVLFQKGDLNEAYIQFKNQYDTSKLNDSRKMIIQSLGNMALIHNIQGNYDKSFKIYEEILSIAHDIYDLRSQAQTYGNLGIIYKNLSDFEKAHANYRKQLKISLKIGDEFQESNSYDGIAIVYHKIGDYKNSIKFHNKAITIEKKINDKNGLASSYCNLSLTYFENNNIKEAKNNLNKGLKIFKDIGNQRAVEIGNYEMSKYLQFEKKLNLAIKKLDSPIIFFEKINDNIYLIKSLIQLGKLQILIKNNDSITSLQKALKISEKIEHNDFIDQIKKILDK